MSKDKYQKQGEAIFAKLEKVNSELLSLTYGALVSQLLKDFELVDEVNEQLEKMGHNIGIRLIEEFLAKSDISFCEDFEETVEVIAKVAFKMFLGISGTVTCVDKESNIYSIIFHSNPLSDFVELPKSLSSLNYCCLLCGVITGALEQIRIRVSCYFVKDMLKGDDYYEIYIQLQEVMKEEILNDEES
ncbi:trafficking protein particle complex subunit 3, putative [Plasmodium ovale]|uniref:Trafficking protein particle complex subunit n=2 Tax=Plasmodium ovale TaxID=36330 RepID=A0A1A8VR79_PLAOA|nr:trafficking protein particle complex subunit 3, putative (BET3) [Plasmodium ovale curtisi]SBS83017.1 trafficking protein particle complex subunit 3, putative (BET3) [Plasmodium ovale curtisi]SCA48700.1 trafficking protein particle complex subunit 3, putative [Plasmodium ovale]